MKKLIVLSAVSLALTGCASWMNIGESKLSGPAPQGFVCADSIDALAMTDNYQSGDNLEYDLCKTGRRESLVGRNQVSPFTGTIPDMNPAYEPKPVLMPAQVMRVWVNAYEAPNGSLVYPGRVFTEVTPRRWNVGYAAGQGIDSNRTISPLMVERNTAPAAPLNAETSSASEAAKSSAPEKQEQGSDLNLNRMQNESLQRNQSGSVNNPLPPLR